MAKQTRQQRRDRRAERQPALAGGPPPRTPPRPTANGGSTGDSEPARKPQRSDERHIPGFGSIHFIQEAWAELKKVEWPTQKAVVSGTAVVLIACLIVGVYLYLNDTLWQYVVQHILLR
jgi:preprotein translocase subunit SecE